MALSTSVVTVSESTGWSGMVSISVAEPYARGRRCVVLPGGYGLGTRSTYGVGWRMHLAAQRLKYSSDTVAAIAQEVGYTSEYAFNRAFARHRGTPPGRYRRLVRAA